MPKYLFPNKYLNYKETLSDIDLICSHFPKKIDIEKIEIAKTQEGRSIIAIRIYPKGKQVEQPTIWFDANMHSIELIGTNVVLAHMENLKNKLTEFEEKYFKVNYVFVPRICPDGAEQYFTEGRRNRSNARDVRSSKEIGSHWKRECLLEKEVRNLGLELLKNKRRIGYIRKENDSGVWTADDLYPQLMRRRELGDQGPFYDIYPEGTIENYDGINIPGCFSVNDNEVDLNRNFPVEWTPNYVENKGGKIALSEIESRAIADFSAKIPQIYFWLNYHTFGGVFIRPLESQDDTAFPVLDRSVYAVIDKKIEEITDYPAVSGHAEFTYEPGKPLQGCLSSYSYHALGAFSYVCELWDLPARLGKLERPFINSYFNWTKKEWRKFYEFDRDQNHSIVYGHPWKEFLHPQLGEVEISEFPNAFGGCNPPQELISEVIQKQIQLLPLLVDISPQPEVKMQLISSKEKNIKYVELKISNLGFLPTHISEARTKAQGKKKIIVEVLETKKGKLIGENSFLLDELDGYIPLAKGWLDSPDTGTNCTTSRTLRVPFFIDKETDNLSAIFKISFPCLGNYYLTLGDV